MAPKKAWKPRELFPGGFQALHGVQNSEELSACIADGVIRFFFQLLGAVSGILRGIAHPFGRAGIKGVLDFIFDFFRNGFGFALRFSAKAFGVISGIFRRIADSFARPLIQRVFDSVIDFFAEFPAVSACFFHRFFRVLDGLLGLAFAFATCGEKDGGRACADGGENEGWAGDGGVVWEFHDRQFVECVTRSPFDGRSCYIFRTRRAKRR